MQVHPLQQLPRGADAKNATPPLDAFWSFCCLFSRRFVLERMGVRHIDLFSLDVEGAELHVLRTINWDKVSDPILFLVAFSCQLTIAACTAPTCISSCCLPAHAHRAINLTASFRMCRRAFNTKESQARGVCQ